MKLNSGVSYAAIQQTSSKIVGGLTAVTGTRIVAIRAKWSHGGWIKTMDVSAYFLNRNLIQALTNTSSNSEL
jgi:hypothetical protein